MKYIFCTNCGKKIIATSKFCPYCGHPIKQTPSEVNSSNQNDSQPNPIVAPSYPSHRNHKGLYATAISIMVLVILVFGGVKLYKNYQYRQNSIKYVNLAKTLPGHTWKQSDYGTTMGYPKFFKNGKQARYLSVNFTPLYSESKIKHDRFKYGASNAKASIANIQYHRHVMIIKYNHVKNDSSEYTGLKLVHHHGNKYMFKVIDFVVNNPKGPHDGNRYTEGHVLNNRHVINLDDGDNANFGPQQTTIWGKDVNGGSRTVNTSSVISLYKTMTCNVTLTLSHHKPDWATTFISK